MILKSRGYCSSQYAHGDCSWTTTVLSQNVCFVQANVVGGRAVSLTVDNLHCKTFLQGSKEETDTTGHDDENYVPDGGDVTRLFGAQRDMFSHNTRRRRRLRAQSK